MKNTNTVTITIPKRSKNETERFFGCNGRRYLVKCGVAVDVPVEVAEIYNNSVAQREAADERISEMAVV